MDADRLEVTVLAVKLTTISTPAPITNGAIDFRGPANRRIERRAESTGPPPRAWATPSR